MSTITREFTKEQLIEQVQQNIAMLKATGERPPENSRVPILITINEIALASLEAEKCSEPVAFINGAWTLVYYRPPKELGLKVGDKLYTAPPAPVSMKDHQIRELVNELRDIAVEYHGTQQLRERISRTVRAAMLQSFGNSEQLNSPVISDGWVACSERMPNAGEQVLAYRPDAPESNDPLIKMATYTGKSVHGHGFDCYCKPTHWMPLPASPQQEVK